MSSAVRTVTDEGAWETGCSRFEAALTLRRLMSSKLSSKMSLGFSAAELASWAYKRAAPGKRIAQDKKIPPRARRQARRRTEGCRRNCRSIQGSKRRLAITRAAQGRQA